MARVSSSTWEDLLTRVRADQPELARGWFEDLRPDSIESGVLKIIAQNQAQVAYLEKHCRTLFRETAQVVTGRLLAVEFTSAASGKIPGDQNGAGDNGFSLVGPRPEYDFENFVVGPCNRLAHAAALAVAETPGEIYNPFFIHGEAGSGKTHLLQAIGHHAQTLRHDIKASFLSCEDFSRDFLGAAQEDDLDRFREVHRHLDLLVIDDIHLLARRERSQEEFFHTFNALRESGRQIVLSSKVPPSQLKGLPERLISRFNSGLVTMLDRPCYETRLGILQKKARLRGMSLPNDVIEFIAFHRNAHPRALEETLLKIDALSQELGADIDLKLAQQALDFTRLQAPTLPMIVDVVRHRFGVEPSSLKGRQRARSIVLPRQVCMYFAHRMTKQSLQDIGRYFGGRDHKTVLHAVRTVTQQAQRSPEFKSLLEELQGELAAKPS